jgi:GT2 family glycosyltransferase
VPVPFVTFVIPSYRRPRALEATLDAVLAVDHPPERLRIVVVDDADDPSTRAIVAARDGRAKDIRYLMHHERGVAGARNLGARQASEGLLIFLDDDIIVEPDHVRRHLAARAETTGLLINGHWKFPSHMRRELENTPFGRFRMDVEDWVRARIPKTPIDGVRAFVPTATACNLSIEVADFRTLGGFDERFPYAGCEDQELSLRADLLGMAMVYDRSIRLLHNDRRVDLVEFCERQRRGAITAVVLAAKHPEIAAERPMIVENAPNSSRRRPRRAVKRALKRALSTRLGLVVFRGMIVVLEHVAPRSRLLRRAYWTMTGLFIFAGIRDGFARLCESDRRVLFDGIRRA